MHDGRLVAGETISDSVDIQIGWRLESGGDLDFNFDGKKGIFSYGIEVAVDGDEPEGFDTVSTSPTGWAWTECEGGPLGNDVVEISRDEGMHAICGERLTLRTT